MGCFMAELINGTNICAVLDKVVAYLFIILFFWGATNKFGKKDEFNDDWRIWGHYSDLPLEERPADTKLRAAYKKWMMAGNKTGYGCGIIILKDGKPMK